MKRATTLLLAVILATVFIPLPATAQPLTADPAVGRLTNRTAYEPGGEHFLFGHSRGTVHKRKGGIKIRPGGTTLSGNIETETVYFNGTYGYETKFHNHHWDEHSPFEERTLRAGKGKGASLSDGFGATNYVYGITATKVHPEDGYDGPQGGGYIKPKGARDIYSYSVIGTASRSRMTTPEKAPCIKGAACPASPFFDGLTPGSETHNDYMRSRKPLDAGEGTAADAAVRAAHADSADNADIGAIAEGIAKQREFQEAYGTTRPYGFTAGQLAAFGKGQSSPMAELAAGGNGIYLKPEYINASINSRIPEPVRQKAGELANQAGDAWRHDKAVLDNTAGKIRNQLGSHLDGSWDNRKTFGANAADKLAGSAGIMKTGLDGLGETTAGKAVGKAVDKVTPDAVKRGIGNAADYGKRSLDSWAGNDLNRQSYANALWGAAAVVADSRLPGKGRGKGHGRHDHDGHARSHDGHNGGKDGGHAHDRADADGGSRAGTSRRHSHDEAGNGGSASGAAHTSTGRSWSDGTFESPRRPEHNRNSDRPRQETPKPERPTRDKPDSPPSRPDASKPADKPNNAKPEEPNGGARDGDSFDTGVPNVKAAPLSAVKGTPLDVDAIRSHLDIHIKASYRVKDISIALASVTINGKTEYFISVSGKAWKGNAPDVVDINGTKYNVVRTDSGSLGTADGGVKAADNFNHAEMKLASHINDTYGNTKADVNIAVQNTSNQVAGACSYCSGKQGNTSVGNLGALNPNMNINFYHGTTGVNP